MKVPCFLALTAILLTGCSKTETSELCGTYQGTLPAASNPGIETTLNFNKDHTFTQKLVYIDEPNGTFTDEGSFSTKDNIVELKTPGETTYYKNEGDQLRRLDMEKQEIVGPLAPYYVLKQTKKCN